MSDAGDLGKGVVAATRFDNISSVSIKEKGSGPLLTSEPFRPNDAAAACRVSRVSVCSWSDESDSADTGTSCTVDTGTVDTGTAGTDADTDTCDISNFAGSKA